MSIKENDFPSFIGKKAKNFLKLEENGFNVPEFMYFNSEYIIENNHKFIYYDEYFKKELKDHILILRPCILDENKEDSFYSLKVPDNYNIHKTMSKYFRQYKKTKSFKEKEIEYGLLIQKYIKAEYSTFVKIMDNRVILSYVKGDLNDIYNKNNTHNIITNINFLNTYLKTDIQNQLINILKELNRLYNDIYVELVYSNEKWYIINIK